MRAYEIMKSATKSIQQGRHRCRRWLAQVVDSSLTVPSDSSIRDITVWNDHISKQVHVGCSVPTTTTGPAMPVFITPRDLEPCLGVGVSHSIQSVVFEPHICQCGAGSKHRFCCFLFSRLQEVIFEARSMSLISPTLSHRYLV